MPPRASYARSGLCALALAGLGAASLAQVAPVPSNPLDQLPLPAERLRPGGGVAVDVAPAPTATPAVLQRQITPTRFDVEGVNAVPFADIASLFTPLVGQTITVGQLVEKAREATALYQRADWGLSFVYIPTQSFDGGVVRVVAVEGHVADVRVEGDAGRSLARVQEIAAHMRAEKPLRRSTFERYAALLGRLPGLTVQARVPLPASTDGASVLTLQVQRKVFDASVASDLRRPQPRGVATATLNDVITPGSQLAVSALVFGRDERLQALQFRQAFGSEGLMLKAAFSAYEGDPDTALDLAGPLERRTRNLRRELSALYPLQLGAAHSLIVSGGFYSVDNTETTTDPTTGDFVADEARVRALFAQLAWERTEARVTRSASVLLAHGLSGAGAEYYVRTNLPGGSGPGTARVDFTRAVLEAREARRWGNGAWGTTVAAAAQVSPHPLPATERISFGGTRYGRAYAPGETSGDRGLGLALELNRNFAPAGSERLRQVQPYLLMEAARVWGELATPVPSRLASLALGVRLADLKHYLVDVSVAKPVGDRPLENAGRSARLTLQFSVRM